MRPSIIAAIICVLLQILNCQAYDPNSRLNFFDIDLLRYTTEGKKGNVMVSPASIKSTLAMILEGAKGLTSKEIKSALRVSPVRDDYRHEMKVFGKVFEHNNSIVSLQNANALFVSEKLNLKTEYESIVRRLYLAEINKLNFNNPKSSAATVNDWVDKKTHGLIPAIVIDDQITPSTEMMIVNALYFKAPWKYNFNVKKTHGECFYNNGNCKMVSMMVLQSDLNYAYVGSLRSHALELPYQDDRYSMIILFAQDEYAEATQIRDYPFVGLSQIVDIMEPAEIALTMPKFDVEYNEDMVGPLQKMAITTLFSQSANLSGIFGQGEDAHINSIYHSVHMKVDEVGTIAAAASSSVVIPLINNQVQLRINRPFLFFIRDKRYDVILFQGKIEEPTEFVENISPPVSSQGPQKVTNQPQAVNNSQPQASSQANVNTDILKYYQADAVRTNYNQSIVRQSGTYQGGYSQKAQQSNQPGFDPSRVYIDQTQPGSSPALLGKPQGYHQGSQNHTNFNLENQPSLKVTKAGTIQSNRVPSQSSSLYQEGLNQHSLNHANINQPSRHTGSSSLPSVKTTGRQPLRDGLTKPQYSDSSYDDYQNY